jgi:hypothetical protein
VPDESHLDQRYFVDEITYNCPFCNRRNVTYHVYGKTFFHWREGRRCHAYFVRCNSCAKESMHLTYQSLDTEALGRSGVVVAWRFKIPEGVDAGEFLDSAFFFSVPTSFFVLDERVPRVLRELLTEAEGCQKSDFLTGASACARKIVYELARIENATGAKYDERIKSLKGIHPEVDPAFFDTLLTIQQVTSDKVHEDSYDGWESKHLRVILASLKEVLHAIYVAPAVREDRRKAVLALKEEVLGKGTKKAEGREPADRVTESPPRDAR